ncbi:MAG: hypothetical protein ABI559_02250 [Chloroflexota bacterium]
MKLALIAITTALAVVLLSACGGGDEKPSTTAAVTQKPASTNGATSAAQSTGVPDETEEPVETTIDNGGSDDFLDACTLLSEDEVTAAIGFAGEGSVTNDSDPPSSACLWMTSDTSQIEIVVNEGDLYGAFTGDKVDGIGDDAKWIESVVLLEVLSHDYDLSISVFKPFM